MKKTRRAATKKLKFTEGFLERLKAPAAGREIYYDTDVKGLGVTVFPSGTKTFHWFRSVRNKPIWKSLADYPDLTLEKAREAAGDWNTARAGWKASGYKAENPFLKPVAGRTLEELKDEYVEQHVKHTKRAERAERELGYLFQNHLAKWKNRPVEEITDTEIKRLRNGVDAEGHRRTANVLVKTLRAFYAFGKIADPTKGIRYLKENESRARTITDEELPVLFAALAKTANVDLQHYVLLSLFCGARKMNTLEALWDDVHLDKKLWVIPDSKSGRYQVELTPEAVEVFKARQKFRVEGNPFVFPSPKSKTGHLMDLKKAWKKLLVSAGLYRPGDPELKVTQHDLRRTCGRKLADGGASQIVCAKALGHQHASAVTDIYTRLSSPPVAKALTKIKWPAMKKIKLRPAAKMLPAAARKGGEKQTIAM